MSSLESTMQRLRSSGSSIWGNLVSTPRLKRKASNTWAAVQDAFFSTKDTFERNKVVFTVGTSLASVATAWIGYSLRYYHETRIDQRLETIEKAMRNSNNLEHSELREIAGSGSISAPTCFATAGTTLIIGYGLGWRGGKWYANRNFRKEQMKLLGQKNPRGWQINPRGWQLLGPIKPRGWKFQFLRRRITRSKVPENAARTSEKMLKDAPNP